MDKTFLQAVINNEYQLPDGCTVAGITAQLMANLGSIDSDLRESSYEVLAGLIRAGTGVNYKPGQLKEIGVQMAHNLTHGLGEQNTDSVFLRAFSLLILEEVIDADGADPYLAESEIRAWLEQGLTYLAAEKDLRGHVPEKGWAHAMAHAADFLGAIVRSRYLAAEDLKRLLNAIADRVTEPVTHTYCYQEDERLAQAVISALLRELLDIDFLNQWLDRLLQPPSGIVWREAYTDPAHMSARHNTITFLRSLYFQLFLGIRYVHHTYTTKTPTVKEDLLSGIITALKRMDYWVYANEE